MRSFIDLQGASGATYRFRPWTEAGQTPMAGNFVAVEQEAMAVRVLVAGVTDDLSRVSSIPATEDLAAERLFVRLNISRQTRESEHDDLVARHQPLKVFTGG